MTMTFISTTIDRMDLSCVIKSSPKLMILIKNFFHTKKPRNFEIGSPLLAVLIGVVRCIGFTCKQHHYRFYYGAENALAANNRLQWGASGEGLWIRRFTHSLPAHWLKKCPG